MKNTNPDPNSNPNLNLDHTDQETLQRKAPSPNELHSSTDCTWRQADPNYPNYRVSDNGLVMTTKNGKLLKQDLNGGYYYVKLHHPGSKPKSFRVSRLVALAFVPIPEDKKHLVNAYKKLKVDHIDDNRLNNKAGNLQWLTNSENMKKARLGKRNPASYFPFTLYKQDDPSIRHTINYGELLDFCKAHNFRINSIKELRRGDILKYKGFVLEPRGKNNGSI